MAKTTSIHINGKHYDALTGTLISESGARKSPVRSIDGVIGGRSTPAPIVSKTATRPSAAAPAQVAKPRPVHDIVRTPAAHAKAHHVKPSKTLMRHTVAKPTVATKKVRSQSHLHATAASHAVIVATGAAVVPKVGMRSIHAKRFHRASKIETSPRVAHFAHELTVDLPQAAEHAVASFSNAIVIPQTFAPNVSMQPIAGGQKQSSNDVFEQALLRATSHEQPAPTLIKSKRARSKAVRSLKHRMVSYGAGAMAVLALVGFLGFANADTIKYRVASNSAGFSASVPDYRPDGFNLASVQSRSGYIGARYETKVDGATRSFALTQKPSNWNSEALRNSITGSGSDVEVSTYEQGGRTVYVYGSDQAAWVSGGMLYQVLGNGVLSIEDFVAIATSI